MSKKKKLTLAEVKSILEYNKTMLTCDMSISRDPEHQEVSPDYYGKDAEDLYYAIVFIEKYLDNSIPIGLYEQMKGERDVAIEQLKSLNIELFEKPYRKAISIEWIEKWFSQFYGEQGLEWNRCKRFMLEEWEKENDKNI